jgi:hypothetical protein
MFIKLTPRAAFWSLVDPVSRKLIVHLTFQKPGPVEVDKSKLSKYSLQILNAGLQHGNIMEVKDPNAKSEQKVVEPKDEDKKGQEDNRVKAQEISAEEFLKQGVRGIRDQLREGTFTAEMLSRAIELEKGAKKPRTTVLTALEQKLNKVGGALAVTESEEEQIEIQLA